jgi:hypothetical protein
MGQRSLVIVAVSVVCLLLSARATLACSCIAGRPACQGFWQTEGVFDGTVVSIEPTTRQLDVGVGDRTISVGERLVKLDVRQSWKGVDTGSIEVVTGTGGGDCGFGFAVGERYLVFAMRRQLDGRLYVSICGFTERFSASSDTARFLESLSRPSAGGRIFGTIELVQQSLNPGKPSGNVPKDLPVRLTGGGRDETVTSKGGRYEFKGLPAAAYQVEVSVPDGYSTRNARQVTLPDPHACAEESYYLSVAGRIVGRLLRHDGRGASDLIVEVTDAGTPLDGRQLPRINSTPTTEDGYFEFKDLPPGQYLVGVDLRNMPSDMSPYPRMLYRAPAGPETIALDFGSTVELAPWTLPPPLRRAPLTGTLVWKDGRPAAGVPVVAWDVSAGDGRRRHTMEGATTDANGRFTVKAWEGRAYALTVWLPGVDRRTQTDVTRLTVTEGMPPVRVTILADRAVR